MPLVPEVPGRWWGVKNYGSKYILNDNLDPIPIADVLRWSRWYDRIENRHVGKYSEDGVCISTVFLGLDHRLGGDGPPILFETLAGGGPFGDEEIERYCTWAEAKAGHDAFVQRAEQGVQRDT
jgi:hypothetical protein